jgi:uncharacterized membrane protein SpoIIM required for sporulation
MTSFKPVSSFANAEQFLTARQEVWGALSVQLDLVEPRRGRKRSAEEISKLAGLYREICTDLTRAQRLGCPPSTIAYLDTMVSRTHSQIYSHGSRPSLNLGVFLAETFPRAVRKNALPLAVANLLFWSPFVIALILSITVKDFSERVLPVEMLEQMARSYQGELSDGRHLGTNASMAGFYVMNNVGIAFRCFATGIIFGLGSVFYLIQNGCVMGAVMGHVSNTGGGLNILAFVAGHSGFELGAIVISGAAGLQMGKALVVTHGRTRLGSLWAERETILAQVVGAGLMLLVAAAIEGFWSPSPVSHQIKWIVGGLNLILIVFYFLFAGRRGAPANSR